ncbi:hypothetical protein Tco_0654689 [Tanacetum coccineum]|uniref:Integrase, catalytic region, zinc finger, CCHC-type, peptidase aspartic, catalytic n=1 Tax=Tanacetum coccineum TaxID=301880 RepID=A0ABQ4X4V0_9ASTR
MSKRNINWTRLCSDVVAFACVILSLLLEDNLCAYDYYVNIMWVCPIVNALAGRILGAYDLGVATPRVVVHTGDKTSGDARSWFTINGDAKSWVLIEWKRMTVKVVMCDISFKYILYGSCLRGLAFESLHFTGIIFKCTQMIKRTPMASADNTSGPAPQRKERCTLQCALSLTEEKSSCFRPFSSTRLVPNPIPQQPCIPPPRDDWDHLFQPMFDEYFNPLTIVVSPVPFAAAPRAVDLADSLVSTSIDQDAPSTKSPKTPYFHDDPLHESLHENSTSQGSSSNVRPIYTPFESLGRWTKDHPIANVIVDPSHSVSTRKQLQSDAMWCYFDAFLTSVKPKNVKQAMTEPSWIDAMQEEIHEFERL